LKFKLTTSNFDRNEKHYKEAHKESNKEMLLVLILFIFLL